MRDTLHLPPGVSPVGLDDEGRAVLAGWLYLAVGALAAAGVLALMLALARAPFIGENFPDLVDRFFRKALVTHVVLAFVVWFLAMLGGLSVAARPGGLVSKIGLGLAATGTIVLTIPALIGQGEPLLVNYVPVLDHPLFRGGLGLLALGVALPVIHLLVRPPAWGGALAMGLGAAGALYLLALLCIFLAWRGFPAGQRFGSNDEPIFWGGGHLFQLVNTTMALTAWQTLGEQSFGRAPLSNRAWQVVCGLLVLTGLPGPVFYAIPSIADFHLREAFTWLYWYGLPVPVLLTGLAVVRGVMRHPPQWNSPAYLALVLSVATFAVGGVFGLFADGQDTRTPAHYHAEIIAVILSLMGLFFAVLMPLLGRGGPARRLDLAQFWLLGVGQIIAAGGMFLAGAAGVGRKIAGEAQGLNSPMKIVGMGLAGVGALVAVIGGVLFIYLALSRLLARSSRS